MNAILFPILLPLGLAAALLSGCGGSGGGSGDTSQPSSSGDTLAIDSLQASQPVGSVAGGPLIQGPPQAGDLLVLDVAPVEDVPYARFNLRLRVNASGTAIDHFDWELVDWLPSPPNGSLTNYNSVIDIDHANRRYLVRTETNEIRYISATLAQLRARGRDFAQRVVVTAWSADGQFASADFILNLGSAADGVPPGWDTDLDGLSDIWETAFSAHGMGPSEDPDRDGRNNYEEMIAGTDPDDPTSVCRIERLGRCTPAWLVRWASVADKCYLVEGATSMASNVWAPCVQTVGTGHEVVAAVRHADPPFDAFRLKLLGEGSAVSRARGLLPETDVDGDGCSDLDEYAAGTDPFDPLSSMCVPTVELGSAVEVTWNSVMGKRYQLEGTSPTGGDAWENVGGPLTGTGDLLGISLEARSSRQLFRLRAEEVDSDLDGLTDWEEQFLGIDSEPPAFRKAHPVDASVIQAVMGASNVVEIEVSAAVANATTGSPGELLIRRQGTINSVIVPYAVGGDAIAGWHYAGLSGSVTIPAGRVSVALPVIPISESGLAPAKSVTVTLLEGPGYTLGTRTTAQVNLIREVALSVVDFGAAGDGVVDDTAAIQAALNALAASTSHNTLFFPEGSYRLSTPTFDPSVPASQHHLLRFGDTDLADRDLVVTGDPNAELYSTVSEARAQMLVVDATFRSLSFQGLRWRKSNDPLPPTLSEPNGADGVTLLRHDLRTVELVEFLDCEFENCHRAVSVHGNAYDAQGRLGLFHFRRCRVANPFGSNTLQASEAFGGGQQVFLDRWVRRALYVQNDFDGGATGPFDPVLNPGGIRKDGAHFGSPLELVFSNNVVRNMAVEAVFQTDEPLMGKTTTTFVVPPEDGTSEATIGVSTHPSTYRAGQIINVRTPATPGVTPGNLLLTVAAYNSASNAVTVINEGYTRGAAGREVCPSLPIYLQDDNPTRATIVDNVIESGEGYPGLAGVGSISCARIERNFISGFRMGVLLYESPHNVLFPPAPGTRVASNVIHTATPTPTGYYTYGIQSWGPGEIIHDNFILAPESTKVIGVATRGADSWVEANTVVAANVVRHPYNATDRSVGMGVGNTSSNNTFANNRTSGFDVGNGPLDAYQGIPRRVLSHLSTNDTLAIDPIGLLPNPPE